MGIVIEPLSDACGAEVRGLDLRRPLDPADWAAVEQAFLDHILLVFRGQDLDDDAQFAFAANFGELARRSRPREQYSEAETPRPVGSLVTNIRKEGKPIGALPDGEMWFHHDGCQTPRPYRATFLYAIEVPSTGGHTMFANMYKAYDRLPEATKRRLDGLTALQIYHYGTVGRVDLSGDISGYNHHVQPVVITHPETGRKALYVNPLMTARIEGISESDSDALLDELFGFVEDRDLIYEHVWRPGDLAVWDNRASTHARTDFPADQTRLLRRCTVEGVKLSG